MADSLIYDVRPKITDVFSENKVADAKPTDAIGVKATQAVLNYFRKGAELFLNGKSLGKKRKAQYEYRLRWDDVVYEPGELKVIAYKHGKVWAEEVVKTTGEAYDLKAMADRTEIDADGRDLSFITVQITDKNGLHVPRSNNRIKFSIEGPGEIVGTDNGDPMNMESFSSHQREAFNGLALVIVRSKAGEKGTIKVIAESAGLMESAVAIHCK